MDRRIILKGLGGTLALPLLEAGTLADQPSPLRLLVVGNPLGMHPENFFPQQFGKTFTICLLYTSPSPRDS